MTPIRPTAHRRVTQTLLLLLAVIAALAVPIDDVGAAADTPAPPVEVETLEQRTIDLSDFGVASADGILAGDGVVYLVGDDHSSLVAVDIGDDPAGSFALSTPIDPENSDLSADGTAVVSLVDGDIVSVPIDGSPSTIIASDAAVSEPAGLAVESASSVAILDASGPSIVRVEGDDSTTTDLDLPASTAVEGMTIDEASGNVIVGVPGEDAAVEFAPDGTTVRSLDLAETDVVDAGPIVSAPSSDPTDETGSTSLFVLDEGNAAVVELAPQAAPLAAPTVNANLVATRELWQLNPPSPDSAGVAYVSHRDNLLVSDSEVNEMPIFQNVNLYEMTRSANLQRTGQTLPWSGEPTGTSYNPGNQHLLVSSDAGGDWIFDVTAGADGTYGTPDDTIGEANITGLGITDAEGVGFDPVSGNAFVSDGVAKEIYQVSPGPDGLFNGVGESLVGNFDVGAFGAGDPEGVTHNLFDDTLLVVDDNSEAVYEVTKTGTLVRTILIPDGLFTRAAGIALAPASDGSAGWNMYIVDRGVDNGADPNENDGRMYELSVDFGNAGAPPTAVDDVIGTPVDTAVVIDVAANDFDLDGNLDPTTAAATSAPAFGSTVDNGDGTITYTPTGAQEGVVTFTYQICDTAALCDTGNVTVTVGGQDAIVYMSFASTTQVPGLGAVPDEDIVVYNNVTGTWSMFFDASDVGITGTDLNAMHILGNGTVVMSFGTITEIPGLINGPSGTTVEPADTVIFNPVSTGANTAGTFTFLLDGSDVGLDTSGENIDGIFIGPWTLTALSTSGGLSIPGGPTASDEDLTLMIQLPASYGPDSEVVWGPRFFDGSDLGLTTSGDDINAFSLAPGSVYHSTSGPNSNPGSTAADVNLFAGALVDPTVGTMTLAFDLSTYGVDPGNVDALHVFEL